MQLSFFKTCATCDKSKLFLDFYRKHDAKDGRQLICKKCSDARQKEYRQAHPEQWNKYYHNRDTHAKEADSEHYYQTQREQDKRRFEKDPERRRAQQRETWSKNGLKYHARRNQRIHQAEGTFTDSEFQELCEKFGNCCLCCGRDDIPLTADHVVPLVKGGRNDIQNIQPLCGSCNSKKHDKTIDYRK